MATESKWNRSDKIGLVVAILTVIGIITAILFPEVRVWMHLQKTETLITNNAPASTPSPHDDRPITSAQNPANLNEDGISAPEGPIIASVSSILPTGTQTVFIRGAGFGQYDPY